MKCQIQRMATREENYAPPTQTAYSSGLPFISRNPQFIEILDRQHSELALTLTLHNLHHSQEPIQFLMSIWGMRVQGGHSI